MKKQASDLQRLLPVRPCRGAGAGHDTGAAAPGCAVTWADVNALKDEANSLDAEKEELQAQLDALADDKSQAVARKQLLDQQIANTEAQISNVQAQIDQYAALITQTEEELAEAEEQEEAQYELFCSRVREHGEAGRGQLLGGAVPGQQLHGPAGPAGRHQRDHEVRPGVIDDLKALQAEIEEKKTTLETSKTESEAAKAQLESKKSELNTQRSEANAIIQELTANESETEAVLADLEAEQDALWAEAQRLSDQLAAQQAAKGKPGRPTPAGTSGRWTAGTSPPPWAAGRLPAASAPPTTRARTSAGWATPAHLRRQVRHRHRLPVLQLLRQLRGHLPRQRQHHPVRPHVQPEGGGGPVCEPGGCDRHHRLHRQLHRAPPPL